MDIKSEVPDDAELESIQLKVEFIGEHQDPQVSSSEVSLFTFKKEVDEILTGESSGNAEDKNKSSGTNLSARGASTVGQRSAGAPRGSADSLPSASCVAPSTSAFKLHKPIAPTPVSITDPCRKDSTAIEKINNKLDVLLDMCRSNRRDIKKILAILESEKPSATCVQPVATFHRATSMEELDLIATNRTVMTELQRCVGVSLRDTTRRMLQRIMTADVAKEMSYSGLGQARQRTKISFKEHPACQLILDALAAVGYNEDQKKKASAIQEVLRHCNDWAGSKRRRVESEKSPAETSTLAQSLLA